MKYIQFTDEQLLFLKRKISGERDKLQKDLDQISDIYFALIFEKTIEDLVPSVKQDAVSQNNDQQSSSDQSDEQSDQSEKNLHLVQAT